MYGLLFCMAYYTSSFGWVKSYGTESETRQHICGQMLINRHRTQSVRMDFVCVCVYRFVCDLFENVFIRSFFFFSQTFHSLALFVVRHVLIRSHRVLAQCAVRIRSVCINRSRVEALTQITRRPLHIMGLTFCYEQRTVRTVVFSPFVHLLRALIRLVVRIHDIWFWHLHSKKTE